MKSFIIDKMIMLLIGTVFALIIPHLFGPISSAILIILIIIIWGFRCKQILLLPFDLLIKRKVKKGHFSTWCFIQRYDVLQMYYSEARFIDKNNEVDIIIPTCCSQAEKVMDLLPPKDRTVIIEYYPLSKILIQWRLIDY